MIAEIAIVVGTRPELVKMAPVIRAFERKREVNLRLIHTGQHYDDNLSGSFFRALNLPAPDINLGIGSISATTQVALMMHGLEECFTEKPPDLVLSEGDTNSVLASALACSKMRRRYGHIEAGLRCFEYHMPEEINRTIADRCADICFAPTTRAVTNLAFERIPTSRVHLTGNPIVDACQQHLETAKEESRILQTLALKPEDRYILLTVHRQENTADDQRLRNLIATLRLLSDYTIVFPVHPRTRLALMRNELWLELSSMQNVKVTEPLSYPDFLLLESGAFCVMTDSGGVQEEAFSFRVPCITLRPSTERPEGISLGLNVIADMNPELAVKAVARYEARKAGDYDSFPNPYGDGHAGERIARLCMKYLRNGKRERHVSPEGPGHVLVSVDNILRDDRVLSYLDPGGNAAISAPLSNRRDGWKAMVVN
ncbi:UDP-N-acetylglucosamine 2-epimerase (non-hydrolyzing) [Candidatus Bathyarchaeota archaeon]|nr:MAG: UDP-N-acetylglucosamine 2-epimerase (non-hydrolyzing) [Candidatus Bathyarchaeota archaeon]